LQYSDEVKSCLVEILVKSKVLRQFWFWDFSTNVLPTRKLFCFAVLNIIYIMKIGSCFWWVEIQSKIYYKSWTFVVSLVLGRCPSFNTLSYQPSAVVNNGLSKTTESQCVIKCYRSNCNFWKPHLRLTVSQLLMENITSKYCIFATHNIYFFNLMLISEIFFKSNTVLQYFFVEVLRCISFMLKNFLIYTVWCKAHLHFHAWLD
jgi:hypothetical protein